MFANPDQPNLPDFRLFVANAMNLGPGLVPQPFPAPAAPSLTPGSSGSLPSGTIYVALTYVSQYGETTASAVASVGITGPDGSVSVASPASAPNATAYNVYAAISAGAVVLQNTSPVAIGTATILTTLATATAAPPTTNTFGSPWPGYALARATALVIPAPPGCGGISYTLACYNGAGHILLTMLPAQPGQPTFPEIRQLLGLVVGSTGIVSASADQGTSNVLSVPDALQQLTLGDLQFMQTPWGRQMLAWNQCFGDVFGLT